MAKRRRFKIGDAVTIRRDVRRRRGDKGARQATTIAGFLPDIEGGVVLSEYLDGFRCWNVSDLEPWKARASRWLGVD